MILLTNLCLFGTEKGKKDAAIFLYHLVNRDKVTQIIELLNRNDDNENKYFELLKPLLKSKYYTVKALAYPNDIDRIYTLKTLDLNIGFSLYKKIEPGAFFIINFAVPEMQENETKKTEFILYYKFRTEDYDLKFGVYKMNQLTFQNIDDLLKEENQDRFTPLIKLQKVNSQNIEIKGTIVINQPGLYQVFFDNSFSYFRAKELRYQIHMLCRDPNSIL